MGQNQKAEKPPLYECTVVASELYRAYQRGSYPYRVEPDCCDDSNEEFERCKKYVARIPEWEEKWPTVKMDLIRLLNRKFYLLRHPQGAFQIDYLGDIEAQRQACHQQIQETEKRIQEWPSRERRIQTLGIPMDQEYRLMSQETFDRLIRPQEVRKTCLSLVQGLVQGGYVPILDMADHQHFGYAAIPNETLEELVKQARQRQESAVGCIRREDMEEGAPQIS